MSTARIRVPVWVAAGCAITMSGAWTGSDPPPGTGINTYLPGQAESGGARFPQTATLMMDGAAQRVTWRLDRSGGYLRGVDLASGKAWHADVGPTGSMRGEDLDGAKWTYSAATRSYANTASGRTCAQTSFLHVCALTADAPDGPERQARMLPHYPPAAQAAGIEGAATLNCARSDGGALVGCALLFEEPAGQGFGQAALGIAGATADIPQRTGAASPAGPITFQFRLHPPAIVPPVLEEPHFMADPDWKTRPTDRDVARVYPPRALAAKTAGRALVKCVLDAQGRATDCWVFDDPPGWDFGPSAVRLVKTFEFFPMTVDEVPTAGGHVTLTIDFARPGSKPRR